MNPIVMSAIAVGILAEADLIVESFCYDPESKQYFIHAAYSPSNGRKEEDILPLRLILDKHPVCYERRDKNA